MKQKKKRKLLHRLRSKGDIIFPLLFIVIAFGVLLVSGAMVNKSTVNTTTQYGEAQVSSGSGKQNLQLKNLTFKPLPTPASSSCNHDNGKPININNGKQYDPNISGACKCPEFVLECVSGKCTKVISIGGIQVTPGPANTPCPFDNWCKNPNRTSGDGTYCLGKPVIYLYPTTKMAVSVKVKTEGQIVVSDPLYPENGWSVIANPNGTITYQGKNYTELFYETASSVLNQPTNGIVIKTSELAPKLTQIITKLGLTKANERREFLDFWLPKLQRLNSPYVLISLLEKSEKERLDKVIISPKPDTFIDFIVYFKPLKTNETVSPLVLPQAPQRVGFTAVEWGGVIGN